MIPNIEYDTLIAADSSISSLDGKIKEKVFSDEESDYIIEESLKPRKDRTIAETLNKGIFRLRNIDTDEIVFKRDLKPKEVQHFRQERKNAKEKQKATKELCKRFSQELKANEIGR